MYVSWKSLAICRHKWKDSKIETFEENTQMDTNKVVPTDCLHTEHIIILFCLCAYFIAELM